MITKLPFPAKEIIVLLMKEGVMTPKEIQQRIDAPSKAIRYALRRLIESGIIKRVPNLLDMRSIYYRISTKAELNEVLPKLSPQIQELVMSAIEEGDAKFEVMARKHAIEA